MDAPDGEIVNFTLYPARTSLETFVRTKEAALEKINLDIGGPFHKGLSF
jgi:hypothetical protein